MTALDPTMVIVSREPDGRWYVTFTIDTHAPEPLEPAGHAVGVDLGVTDFAVTSDGEKIANPRHLARKARNLARYQRRLARCRKGSANRAKATAKVARAHRKVRDARRDFMHCASTGLVRSADVIAIEDLNVSGIIRNRHLARAISDCGWGEFRFGAGSSQAVSHLFLINGETTAIVTGPSPATGYATVGAGVTHPGPQHSPDLSHPPEPAHPRCRQVIVGSARP